VHINIAGLVLLLGMISFTWRCIVGNGGSSSDDSERVQVRIFSAVRQAQLAAGKGLAKPKAAL